ncbi:MAG: hypothetical protein KF819_34630 [Labilithrix sp.]|nr:hypothetical protein [Labilithrix sp.]
MTAARLRWLRLLRGLVACLAIFVVHAPAKAAALVDEIAIVEGARTDADADANAEATAAPEASASASDAANEGANALGRASAFVRSRIYLLNCSLLR